MDERLIRYRRRRRSPGPPADSSPCTCSPTVSRRPPAGAHGAGACPSHLCWAAAERRARSPMGFPVTSARPEGRVHRSRPRRGPRLRDGQIWTMLERRTTRSVPPSQYPRRRPRPSITAGVRADIARGLVTVRDHAGRDHGLIHSAVHELAAVGGSIRAHRVEVPGAGDGGRSVGGRSAHLRVWAAMDGYAERALAHRVKPGMPDCRECAAVQPGDPGWALHR
jgi:hypothetical protein